MSAVDFTPGELVEWLEPDTRKTDPVGFSRVTTRPVAFKERIGDQADVMFGPDVFRVPLEQLRRPKPTPVPPHLRLPPAEELNWWTKPPRPRSIDYLREALRRAHSHRSETGNAVDEAAAVAKRADDALVEARAALGEFADDDARLSDDIVGRLRRNEPPPPGNPAREAKRSAAQRVVYASEAASRKLTAELAEARARLAEAVQQVRAAANAIVVEIAQGFGAELLRIEQQVADMRASLRALATFRPNVPGQVAAEIPLPGNLIELLHDRPPPPGSTAAVPWPGLFEALIAGDADADLIDTPAASTG